MYPLSVNLISQNLIYYKGRVYILIFNNAVLDLTEVMTVV